MFQPGGPSSYRFASGDRAWLEDSQSRAFAPRRVAGVPQCGTPPNRGAVNPTSVFGPGAAGTALVTMISLHPTPLDYSIMGIYFVVVLGIGFAARRYIKTDVDFFLSG